MFDSKKLVLNQRNFFLGVKNCSLKLSSFDISDHSRIFHPPCIVIVIYSKLSVFLNLWNYIIYLSRCCCNSWMFFQTNVYVHTSSKLSNWIQANELFFRELSCCFFQKLWNRSVSCMFHSWNSIFTNLLR